MRSIELYAKCVHMQLYLYEETLQEKGKHQVFISLEKIKIPQLC